MGQTLPFGFACYVEMHIGGCIADFSGYYRPRIILDVGQDDGGALLGKQACFCRALASCRARDECNFSAQLPHSTTP